MLYQGQFLGRPYRIVVRCNAQNKMTSFNIMIEKTNLSLLNGASSAESTAANCTHAKSQSAIMDVSVNSMFGWVVNL